VATTTEVIADWVEGWGGCLSPRRVAAAVKTMAGERTRRTKMGSVVSAISAILTIAVVVACAAQDVVCKENG
jgi:hypothetical protein